MARAKLAWDYTDYRNPAVILENKTEKEMRKEYSRLRSIARKRLERLAESEFRETQTYKRAQHQFIPLADVPNKIALAYKLKDVFDFVNTSKTTVTGMRAIRKKSIDTLKAHNIDFVTEENYLEFGEFMRYARAKAKAKLFDSDQAVALYEWAKSKEINPDRLKYHFNEWLQNAYDIQNFTPKVKRGKTLSSKQLNAQLRNYLEDY